MTYGWILLAMLAGLWTGLSLPYVTRRLERRQEQKAAQRTEENQEQLLTEWLYGEKQEIEKQQIGG